jgi:hypothetical protein
MTLDFGQINFDTVFAIRIVRNYDGFELLGGGGGICASNLFKL